jgi:hypothetical protein
MGGPDATDGALAHRIDELETENARLRSLLGLDRPERAGQVRAPGQTLFAQVPSSVDPTVTQGSTTKEKVHLYRSLFRGRDDVYAQRWEQVSTGKKG